VVPVGLQVQEQEQVEEHPVVEEVSEEAGSGSPEPA
jgi:hypothetical protein